LNLFFKTNRKKTLSEGVALKAKRGQAIAASDQGLFPFLVEMRGIEPLASALRTPRSPS
jgi:hypothetical protein